MQRVSGALLGATAGGSLKPWDWSVKVASNSRQVGEIWVMAWPRSTGRGS